MSVNTYTLVAQSPYIKSRNSLARTQQIRTLALIPVFIAAVLTTGQQYLVARARALDAAGEGEWRDRTVDAIGVNLVEPGVVDSLVVGLVHVLPVLFVAFLTALLWERLFAIGRDRNLQRGLFVIALTLTMLMPPAVSLWHVVFGMSFGLVFGRCIFGGEGKTFLNPALLAAAVMQIAYPSVLTDHPLWSDIAGYAGTKVFAAAATGADGMLMWSAMDWWAAFVGSTQGLMGVTSVAAIMIGGVILVATRIASWRLIAGHIVGVVLLASLSNALSVDQVAAPPAWHWHIVLGAFAFGCVFVAADPASAASTNAGRWTQGIIAGALVVILRIYHPAHPDAVIPALLLGSILAPLIDHIVIALNVRRRRRASG